MNEFSFSTVDNFDEHISKSIRGYSNLIEDVVSLSKYFLESNTCMVDIGSSTGSMLIRIRDENKKVIDGVLYLGVENEPNMITNQIQRTGIKYCNIGIVDFEFPANCSMITSIFTLQFIPRSVRQTIVSNIYNSLNDGCAFIFSEKLYASDARVQDMLTFIGYDSKRKYFNDSDILDKEKSLRHMLRSYTEDELIGENSIIRKAGFTKIEPFWRNLNFAGYIAIK